MATENAADAGVVSDSDRQLDYDFANLCELLAHSTYALDFKVPKGILSLIEFSEVGENVKLSSLSLTCSKCLEYLRF